MLPEFYWQFALLLGLLLIAALACGGLAGHLRLPRVTAYLLVGVALVADGLDFHIPCGYVYFAMMFSLSIEMLNMRYRARQENA